MVWLGGRCARHKNPGSNGGLSRGGIGTRAEEVRGVTIGADGRGRAGHVPMQQPGHDGLD
jgi:hypothetical protein